MIGNKRKKIIFIWKNILYSKCTGHCQHRFYKFPLKENIQNGFNEYIYLSLDCSYVWDKWMNVKYAISEQKCMQCKVIFQKLTSDYLYVIQ